jgi:hypothetical protein
LADVTYNPTVAAEGNIGFDSKYDDMLVARIITNSSNVATITPLANKNSLSVEGNQVIRATAFGGTAQTVVPLNWARRPNVAMQAGQAILDSNNANGENDWGTIVNDRYSIGCFYRRTFQQGDGGAIFYTAWMQ